MTIKWKQEHLDLLGTMPDEYLAEIVGCNSCTVGLKRKECGIPPVRKHSKKRESSPEILARSKIILKLRQNGLSLSQIGKKFGISRQRVHQILTKGLR